MPANKHTCNASHIYREIVKYWQILGNTGKYDLNPGTFTLNIKVVNFNNRGLNSTSLLVYQAISKIILV